MSVDIQRLRKWFAGAAIALAMIVVVFYSYGRVRLYRSWRQAPEKLGLNVQQSTQGFTLSKSEAGRTLFTVHASNAVQYKQGGRAQLHDVTIVVYGREANRFDQIYGADFEYDPPSDKISARGEVEIELQGNSLGPLRPDQAFPPELKTPIHLKTSGLIFNQKTGVARTQEKIEFRAPQASGTAMGAVYKGKENSLTLESDLNVETGNAGRIRARHAVIAGELRQVVLSMPRISQPAADIAADELVLFLREDNSVGRMTASGNVHAQTHGADALSLRAPEAELYMGEKGTIRTAVLSGGVTFEQQGGAPVRAATGKALLDFGPQNTLARVTAGEGFQFRQEPKSNGGQGQEVELDSSGANLLMANRRLVHAETTGAAQILIRPQAAATKGDTMVTAARFEVSLDPLDGHMKALHGAPDARIVSSAPGQPQKVSTSRQLDVAFNSQGGVAEVMQSGDVNYSDGQRKATAAQARYNPFTADLVLTGNARFIDAGSTTTARLLHFNQKTGEAQAAGDVKTTYKDARTQPGGPMLAASDPVHVTADAMTARSSTTVAKYVGSARLWQGANVIAAPAIAFDQKQRSVLAQGTTADRVTTVFVQRATDGQATPVEVTATRLTYSDAQRSVRFEGGVVIRTSAASMTAPEATAFLMSTGQTTVVEGSRSQLDRIVAEGGVAIQEPSRKATGDHLLYTANDGKYVLTGTPASIFDAEHGRITGDSLTFYSRDGRVLVGSTGLSRTLTRTWEVK